MITEQTRMKIADCIKHFLTRVRPNDYKEKCVGQNGKRGVIIYHAPSNSYFSGVTTNIEKYFDRTIASFVKTNTDLPAVVRQMVSDGGFFEFYFFQFHVRNQIEQELARAGVKRVVTAMGSQIKGLTHIYEIHSVVFDFTRYVSCGESEDIDAILKRANASILRWLKESSYSGGSGHTQLNEVFRFELMQKPAVIFKPESTIVTKRPRTMSTLTPKYFRTEVERLNLQSIKAFLGKINGVPRSVY